MKTINEFFFMRDGFQTFRLEPDKHNFLLFGARDRAQRDHLLDHLEEASYSIEGHKSVVIGDFGRGKTHQSRNIQFEIRRRGLNLHPVYVKCPEFKSKEPFTTFFKEIVLGLPVDEVNRLAQAYEQATNSGKKPALETILDDQDIAKVFRKGLAAPNPDMTRISMRWLGGEKVDMEIIAGNLLPLTMSKHFGTVMKGMVQLFREIDGKVPLYLIDEAERFTLVTSTDNYWSWLAALRELTEIVGVAFIFFIGAKTRDEIPAMFAVDEVRTRIGVSNYVEFYNQGREDLKDFLKELFQTIIRKGDVPSPLKAVLDEQLGSQFDSVVPDELMSILEAEGSSLSSYPFTDQAFEQFVEECTSSDLSNKPREVLIRVQKAAGRAMRINSRLIDGRILEEITRDGV
jgi:hypothetical protein